MTTNSSAYPDGALRSSYAGAIVRKADGHGYQNILLPSGWIVGQDALTFAAAMAPQTPDSRPTGCVAHGRSLAADVGAAIATVDHIAQGRLCINIISSDMPGMKESGAVRLRAKQRDHSDSAGAMADEWSFNGMASSTTSACPTLKLPNRFSKMVGRTDVFWRHFTSSPRSMCKTLRRVSDVARTEERVPRRCKACRTRRSSMDAKSILVFAAMSLCRKTEAEARAAANRLISKLDLTKGAEIKARSLDSQSDGVKRQDELRAQSKDLYIEPHLWSGIGLARGGCASAISEQVLAKLQRYMEMGIRAFILSGYPHLEECDLFAKYVLPRLPTCRLNEVQGRLVDNPVTPLTSALRV